MERQLGFDHQPKRLRLATSSVGGEPCRSTCLRGLSWRLVKRRGIFIVRKIRLCKSFQSDSEKTFLNYFVLGSGVMAFGNCSACSNPSAGASLRAGATFEINCWRRDFDHQP